MLHHVSWHSIRIHSKRSILTSTTRTRSGVATSTGPPGRAARSLPRAQMPAVRMSPWARLPEMAMTPARRRGAHPLWIVVGAAAGAGLMYFFDREHGQRRREIVRDKARTYLRQTTEKVDGTSRDMMTRARGLVVELRSKVGARESREPWVPETTPEARQS